MPEKHGRRSFHQVNKERSGSHGGSLNVVHVFVLFATTHWEGTQHTMVIL